MKDGDNERGGTRGGGERKCYNHGTTGTVENEEMGLKQLNLKIGVMLGHAGQQLHEISARA